MATNNIPLGQYDDQVDSSMHQKYPPGTITFHVPLMLLMMVLT